ncbi:hypothetical protein [Deinococcus cellulosilyticus]|uniref:Uncharacterized protein n=1 Tax=Deinococcus cellulosilyticus (strain DSM 18568 / NBRC 106333 / KACC 11606 / 5516J-15) TaxID=1223518 RepID=A0A511N8Z5_DEIC1|nr:hypothetical protein [Deinococcus cellulosilyticus]GEM49007.1 hypothetical protein DC3_46420 [Deinococcus cellulosilyticus NBRC 106333 = KACC 11606]
MIRRNIQWWNPLRPSYIPAILLALSWPLLWAWILLDWLVFNPFRLFDNPRDNTYNVLLDVFLVVSWISPLLALWTYRTRGWHWSAALFLLAFGLFLIASFLL